MKDLKLSDEEIALVIFCVVRTKSEVGLLTDMFIAEFKSHLESLLAKLKG